MSIDWERCAHDALKAFPVTPKQVKLISRSENVSFFVEADTSERFVLRIHRPEYHTLDELISEQIWVEALLEDGIDVPVPLRTKQGERYARVRVGEEIRYAGMLHWVDGQSLREQDEDSKRLDVLVPNYERVGRLLATLHNQASNWRSPGDHVRHAFDADGLMGEKPFWGRFWEADDLDSHERQELLRMRNRIYAVLARLPKTHDVYSMIHADLHTGNLIVHGDQLHVIDFDDAGFGWHAYDFAVAMSEIQTADVRTPLLTALLDGYAELRELTDWVRELIPLFDTIRNLVSIGWIDARPDLHRDPAIKRHLCQQASRKFHNVIEEAESIVDGI